jgi:predicted dehydrogenase
VLGSFASVEAIGVLTDEGVDAQDSITVRTAEGAFGLLGTTMLTKTPTRAAVCGTRAMLDIEGDFYSAGVPVRLVAPDGTRLDEYAFPVAGHRLDFEAAEVARCLADGLTESPLMPWSETLAVMATMDAVRAEVGVRYPGE